MKRTTLGAFGVPAGLLAAALGGAGNAAIALACGIAWMTAWSLAAHDALARALGRLTRPDRAAGAALCALAMAAAGGAAGLFAGCAIAARLPICLPQGGGIAEWLAAALCAQFYRVAWAASGARRRPWSLRALDIAVGAGVAAALYNGSATAAALAAAVGAVALFAWTAAAKSGVARSAVPLREVPAALLRELPYPLLCAAIVGFLTSWTFSVDGASIQAAVLAGWLALELGRTAYRRDDRADLPLRLAAGAWALAAAAAALACAQLEWHAADVQAIAAMLMLASGCALCRDAAVAPRTVAAAILLFLAALLAALPGIPALPRPASLPPLLLAASPLLFALAALVLLFAGVPRALRARRARKAMRRKAAGG